jgi:hypothetical protein
MILAHISLQKRINLDYDTGCMQWNDSVLPMSLHKRLASMNYNNMEDMYQIKFKDTILGQDWHKLCAT